MSLSSPLLSHIILFCIQARTILIPEVKIMSGRGKCTELVREVLHAVMLFAYIRNDSVVKLGQRLTIVMCTCYTFKQTLVYNENNNRIDLFIALPMDIL